MEKIFTIDQIKKIAKELVDKILYSPNGEAERATIVALSGELGAGKTALTQEIGKLLGIKEKMISPTFVIMKNYLLETRNCKLKTLVHVDAYRLESSEELLGLGWQEIISDSENIIFIEWPEQVPECIPESAHRVELKHIDEETRSIQIML